MTKETVFVGILYLLALFFFLYIPYRNSTHTLSKEDLVPISPLLPDSGDLCEATHGHVWVEGDIFPWCPICKKER